MPESWPVWRREPPAPGRDRKVSVIFSAPDADGLRRGIAFQRIWGEADTLRVTCGYADYVKTKPENLTVAVYRVFAPGGG